jgi:hypothetical protein
MLSIDVIYLGKVCMEGLMKNSVTSLSSSNYLPNSSVSIVLVFDGNQGSTYVADKHIYNCPANIYFHYAQSKEHKEEGHTSRDYQKGIFHFPYLHFVRR